jgi:hypothetical protein
MRVGPSLDDLYPTMLLALGIFAGFHEARRSGEGRLVCRWSHLQIHRVEPRQRTAPAVRVGVAPRHDCSEGVSARIWTSERTTPL